MRRGFGLAIALVIASIVSAAYWRGVMALLERATSFEYTRGGEPDDTQMMIKAIAGIVAGSLVCAAILFAAVRARGGRAAAARSG